MSERYLQSQGMRQREASYYARTKDRVYLGVGSYGSDQARYEYLTIAVACICIHLYVCIYEFYRAGLCYRMSLTGVDRDLIAQVLKHIHTYLHTVTPKSFAKCDI